MTPNSDSDDTLIKPRELIYVTITLEVSDNSTFINDLIEKEVTSFSFDIHIHAEE